MKKYGFILSSVVAIALTSCQSDKGPAPSSSLEGTWRLTNRQCYCLPGPVPDETVTFTPTRFVFYKGNRATRLGRHSFTTASPPCLSTGTAISVLRFATKLQFPDSTANTYSADVRYNVSNNTLTLDYGSPCDFPLDTYERVQ
ncbi:hypothetical protein GCM10022409_40620 [Hymenobacter glaciei]|uniref:Lipocalin-like domain-containing protein n=1 Tax=Hymenobacter glaciei TaxID=877209 RepID=A0ABP7UQH1_9BACT